MANGKWPNEKQDSAGNRHRIALFCKHNRQDSGWLRLACIARDGVHVARILEEHLPRGKNSLGLAVDGETILPLQHVTADEAGMTMTVG